MKSTDVIIIGGGQAGLAMSRELTMRGIDHVVLERGRIGERWRSERWRSLHLLTISSQSALPGLPHVDVDPQSFLPASAFAGYLDRYAEAFSAPIVNGADVIAVDPSRAGYRVATTAGQWWSRAVVIATGACDVPYRPAQATRLPLSVLQISPTEYRAPDRLPDGGVLVVGASSTGVQIAEEVHASGRPVTLAVGDHTRMVRHYRGRDIYVWMEVAGLLDDRADASGNIEAARRQPSLQLVGSHDHRELNLSILVAQGVRLVGRLARIDGRLVEFKGDLEETTTRSHLRLVKTLRRIDDFVEGRGLSAPPLNADWLQPFIAHRDASVVDLKEENIRTVIWATGYKRCYKWLNIPVTDAQGEIIHRGGITSAPGLYVLGLTFLRRRRSSFIDGCGLDAAEIAAFVNDYLNRAVEHAA